jgi:hypothetical protein
VHAASSAWAGKCFGIMFRIRAQEAERFGRLVRLRLRRAGTSEPSRVVAVSLQASNAPPRLARRCTAKARARPSSARGSTSPAAAVARRVNREAASVEGVAPVGKPSAGWRPNVRGALKVAEVDTA